MSAVHRRKNNPGRPRIALDIEQLVCKMVRENEWGYARIQGELKKLDVAISKSSVANILRRNGLPRGVQKYTASSDYVYMIPFKS